MLRGLALGLCAYFVAAHLWAFILLAPHAYRRADFRQFYAAGYMLRTGNATKLYNFDDQTAVENRIISEEDEGHALPFVSPAYHAVLMSPLSMLPYKTAYIAFVAMNLASLTLIAVMLWPSLSNLRGLYWWLPVGVLLGFRPIGTALIWGQDSILLATAISIAFVLIRKKGETTAGAILALALFKFQIVIPIALLFLLWREWKIIRSFSLVAAGLAIVSISITGVSQSLLYVRSLLGIASLSTHQGMAHHPISWTWMPNITGFLIGIFGDSLPRTAIIIVSAILSIAVLGLSWSKGRALDNAARLLLAIPTAVLVGYHTYIYDLSPLVLPLLILLNEYLPAETDRSSDRWLFRIAGLMFIAPMIDSLSLPHSYLVAIPVFLMGIALSYSPQESAEIPVVAQTNQASFVQV